PPKSPWPMPASSRFITSKMCGRPAEGLPMRRAPTSAPSPTSSGPPSRPHGGFQVVGWGERGEPQRSALFPCWASLRSARPTLEACMKGFLQVLIGALLLTVLPGRAAELVIGLGADVTSIDPHFVNLAP